LRDDQRFCRFNPVSLRGASANKYDLIQEESDRMADVAEEELKNIWAWAECRTDLEIGEFKLPKEKRLERIEQLVIERLTELGNKENEPPCGDGLPSVEKPRDLPPTDA
jgi:hypothetical protein